MPSTASVQTIIWFQMALVPQMRNPGLGEVEFSYLNELPTSNLPVKEDILLKENVSYFLKNSNKDY